MRAPLATMWLLAVCGCVSPTAAAPTSTRPTHIAVADDASLLAVLQQPAVQHISLAADVALSPDGSWARERAPGSILLRHNVTISSPPGQQHELDLAFLGDGQLALAPGTVLTFSNLALRNARYGAGMQLDLVDPASPGAVVVYSNVVFQRAACAPVTDEPAAVALQPRLPGYPGQQRARYLERFCWRDECRTQVLLFESFTKLSTATADTAAGGFALVLVNTTKLCDTVAVGCATSRSQDECVRRTLDAALTTAPTPGQRAAAAAAAESRRAATTTAAAVGASVGVVLLALLLLLLLVVRPRLRKRREAAAQQKAGGGGAAASALGASSSGAGSGSTLGRRDGSFVAAAAASADAASATDLEAAFGAPAASAAVQHSSGSAGTSSSVQSGSSPGPAVLRSPPADLERRSGHHSPSHLADTWAVVASKTSPRFAGGAGPQRQPSNAASVLSRSSSGGSSGTLDWPGRHAALSSYDGMLQGLPAASKAALLSLNRISLGVLLGAGAFGRVFKGKWRGMDVAVKVLQHSQAAAAAVANEVDLSLRFQHANVVSAHHFVERERERD